MTQVAESTALITDPDATLLAEVALTRAEFDLAVAKLGRGVSEVELGIIGALWSEHCGYKSSKPLLSRLPTTGAKVLQGPGENAGAVDIGDGLACVFKIESHNHPSAIEPYQGAATGVGGILRDVFTMGARPVALLDSLRFGELSDPSQRRLLEGVVAGIGGYGNCMGIPTVGGEVYFDKSYTGNCLVNAMCVGIIEQPKLTRAKAAGVGNPVLLVGADTGRDGIHGATFASVELSEASVERRPAVQVGNPFLEKCLMEACLALAGDPRIVAMQDLGAAGLTSSAAELAHRGDCGIDLDVGKVARRERGMTAYEVMLSESQERMLLVVKAGMEAEIQAEFERWDLHSDVIGSITDSGAMRVRNGDDLVCDLPLAMLIDEVPLRHHKAVPPPEQSPVHSVDAQLPINADAGQLLLRLLGSPNIGSRRPIFRRYDHQVGNDTVIAPGGDAALLRIKGTTGAVAVTTDCNAAYVALNPRRGTAIAVAEAARNISSTGATPLAVTNCLNFGNPEKSEVFWQLSEAIEGMREACLALETPVVSGNVSLYNDSTGVSVDPTPVIGMVGHLGDVSLAVNNAFCDQGDEIFVVGPDPEPGDGWGGSELQRALGLERNGEPPQLNLGVEAKVQEFVRACAAARLLKSAHDVSDGGLAVAIAESAMRGDIGCEIAAAAVSPLATTNMVHILFSETQSRFVISASPEVAMQLRELAGQFGVPLRKLGVVGGDHLRVGSLHVTLVQARRAYDGALLETL